MRIATPYSLLTVTLVPADGDDLIALGPFSNVNCMDDRLSGEHYSETDQNRQDQTLAYYDPETKRWFSADGRGLIVWTVQSVDETVHKGHPAEVRKAEYIRREFPPEATSAFAG